MAGFGKRGKEKAMHEKQRIERLELRAAMLERERDEWKARAERAEAKLAQARQFFTPAGDK